MKRVKIPIIFRGCAIGHVLTVGAIAAVLALAVSTAASAQSTAYERWCAARNQLEAYKQMTPYAAKIKRPWYAGWSSLKYTPAADGGGTLFIWDGGLNVRYDYGSLNTTAWDHADNRTRPTGSTTITLSATGITIKTYNDVQLNTTFDEDTGAPKVPSDPYREYFGCRGGTAQRDLMFHIGQKRYTCKASVTCSHSHKVIFVARSSRGRNGQGQMTTFGGQQFVGDAGNFLSPQKFMHTQTISISYATLANAAGMTENEFFQHILGEGLTLLRCQGFATGAGNGDAHQVAGYPRIEGLDGDEEDHMYDDEMESIYDRLGQMLTVMAAKKCGATEAEMKAAFLQQASSASIASMNIRKGATDKLIPGWAAYSGDFEDQLLGSELMLMCLYRYQQLFDDYTALYNHFQQTNQPDLLTQVKINRLQLLRRYNGFLTDQDRFFTKPFAAAKQSLDAACANDPDPDVRNIDFDQLSDVIANLESSHLAESAVSAMLRSWQKPLLDWTGEKSDADNAVKGVLAFSYVMSSNWNAFSAERSEEVRKMLADSLLNMYNTAVRLRQTAAKHYLHWRDNDSLTGPHIFQAANNYYISLQRSFDVAFCANLLAAGTETDGNGAGRREFIPADTLQKLKEVQWIAAGRLLTSLYRLHYMTRGQTDGLLWKYYLQDGTDVDALKISYKPVLNHPMREFYEVMVDVYGQMHRSDDDYRRFIYEEVEGIFFDIDMSFGNLELAIARGDMILETTDPNETWAPLRSRISCALAQIYYTKGDFIKAKELIQVCADQHIRNAAYISSQELLGFIDLEQGNTKAAKKWLKDNLMTRFPEVDWTQRPLYKKLRGQGEVK